MENIYINPKMLVLCEPIPDIWGEVVLNVAKNS